MTAGPTPGAAFKVGEFSTDYVVVSTSLACPASPLAARAAGWSAATSCVGASLSAYGAFQALTARTNMIAKGGSGSSSVGRSAIFGVGAQ
jgi:hypothetical protein